MGYSVVACSSCIYYHVPTRIWLIIDTFTSVLVHAIVFTSSSSKSLFYRLDHAFFLIWSSPGLPLAYFRGPQQIFEKHLLEHFCCKLSGTGTSCKTDSSHVERCKICSQASLHMPPVASISGATVLNDHSIHCNHQSCVEALFLAMIFDTSF